VPEIDPVSDCVRFRVRDRFVVVAAIEVQGIFEMALGVKKIETIVRHRADSQAKRLCFDIEPWAFGGHGAIALNSSS